MMPGTWFIHNGMRFLSENNNLKMILQFGKFQNVFKYTFC